MSTRITRVLTDCLWEMVWIEKIPVPIFFEVNKNMLVIQIAYFWKDTIGTNTQKF